MELTKEIIEIFAKWTKLKIRIQNGGHPCGWPPRNSLAEAKCT